MEEARGGGEDDALTHVGGARRVEARRGRGGKAGLGEGRHSRGEARQGVARQGKARRGVARQCKARRGEASQRRG